MAKRRANSSPSFNDSLRISLGGRTVRTDDRFVRKLPGIDILRENQVAQFQSFDWPLPGLRPNRRTFRKARTWLVGEGLSYGWP